MNGLCDSPVHLIIMKDKALIYFSLAVSAIALTISIIGLCYAARIKTPGDIYISQQTQLAKAGIRWAEFHLWDAYAHGANGVKPSPAKADQWLRTFVKDVYVVRFESAGNFHPQNAMEYLNDIQKHTSEWRSDDNRIGVAGFLRTTKEGDKLVAAQLTNEPEKLKALIEANSDLKFDSEEAMTPESFIKYEKSPQESL